MNGIVGLFGKFLINGGAIHRGIVADKDNCGLVQLRTHGIMGCCARDERALIIRTRLSVPGSPETGLFVHISKN